MNKKYITSLIITMAFILGCSGMMDGIIEDEEAKEQATLIVIKMSAREFAKQLCEQTDCYSKFPQVSAMINAMIQQAEKGNVSMIKMGQNYLLSLCMDDYLRDDLTDLFELMKLTTLPDDIAVMENAEIQKYLKRMEYALRGFRQGLEKKLEST